MGLPAPLHPKCGPAVAHKKDNYVAKFLHAWFSKLQFTLLIGIAHRNSHQKQKSDSISYQILIYS